MGNKRTKTKTISLDKKLVEHIEHLSTIENRNFSNMVETLLMKQLKF